MTRAPPTHPVLRFMAKAGMYIGDGVPIDAIVDYGITMGLSLEEIEAALIQANSQGWITAVEKNVHLTRSGYVLLHPANDNPSPKRGNGR